MAGLLVDLYFLVAFLMFARCVLQARPVVKKWCKSVRVGRILVSHTIETIQYARYLKTPTGMLHVGDETVLREHKIFPVARYVDPYSLFKGQTITPEVNDQILQCMYDTIEKYFLKYLVTFSRTDAHDVGKLMIGLSDEGKPIGIPLLQGTNVSSSRIADIIASLRPRMRGLCNGVACEKTLEQYLRLVKIKIETLQPNSQERYFHVAKMVEDVDAEKKENEMMQLEFEGRMVRWSVHRDKFLVSLENLCRNPITRQEIIDYCMHGRDTQAPQDVIDTLRSDDEIVFPIGTVREEKKDESTMAFWVTNFKEDMRASQAKPRPRVRKRNAQIKMMQAANDLSFMRPLWRTPVAYRMIVIEYPTSLGWNKWVEYKVTPTSKEWTSLTRTMDGNGPSCVHR